MKKLLLVFLLLSSVFAKSQNWTNLSGSHQRPSGMWPLTILKLPADTSTNKTGLAQIGQVIYFGNGTYWQTIKVSPVTVDWQEIIGKPVFFSTNYDSSNNIKDSLAARELLSNKVTTIISPNGTDYPSTGAVNGFVYGLTVGKLNASDTNSMLLPYRNQINKNTDSINSVKTQVANNAIALAGKTDTSKSRNDSFVVSQNAHQKLKSWSNKVTQIRNARVSGTRKNTANIASIWDSVKDDFTFSLFNPIFNALGYGGQDGAFAQQGLSPIIYGTSTQVGVPVLITSLTRSGTTATATSAGHGLSNGTTVTISGTSASAYNITTTISNVTTNTFDYTVSGSPATPDPSTQIYFTVAANFNKWVTGSYINISSTGGYGIVRNTQGTQLTDTPTIAKVYYLKESGAGSFKLQASADNSTWFDVSGYTSISASNASGIDSLGIVSAPYPSSLRPFFRVYGVSGVVKIIGLGFANPSGGKISNMLGAGGLALADMATTPEHIIGAYLLDFQPDVMTFMGKDGIGDDVVAAYQTWQQRIYKYAPQCATIWSSAYESADTSGSNLQNIKMKRWFDTTTLAGERYWIDAYNYIGKWVDASFKGLYDAGSPIDISSISYSGSTLSLTTLTAHGLSYPMTFRLNGVSPFGYDNIYVVQTAPTSTTLTGTRINTAITPSAATGSGGTLTKVDGTHLGNSGRLLLGNAFNRDFSLLTGNNTNYPFLITAAALDSANVYPKTGGTISGAVTITNTNDYNASSPSLSTLGGIGAAKDISTNTSVRAADFLASGNTAFLANTPNPYLYFNKTNGTTNQKGWSISANRDGFFDFNINNDDNSLNNRWLSMQRSGTTGLSATFSYPVNINLSNSNFNTQIAITNTSTSGNSLAGFSSTVNNILRGGAVGTPYNYVSGAQDSAMMFFSAGLNKVLITADYTSANGGKDVAIQTIGNKTTPDILVEGSTGKVFMNNELTTKGNIIATTTKTNAYTATGTDEVILADATSAAFSVTLPTAVGRSGQRYVIKKTDVSANAVTVATTSSQTIDGSTTYSLATQYKFVTVVSNGNNWMITGNN